MNKDRASRCYCAVPEDRPVPGFVADGWEFRGRVAEADPVPGGFRADAAQAATRATGYYVFHGWQQQVATSPSGETPTLTRT